MLASGIIIDIYFLTIISRETPDIGVLRVLQRFLTFSERLKFHKIFAKRDHKI